MVVNNSQLIFNREDKFEATNSSCYSTKLGTIPLYIAEEIKL